MSKQIKKRDINKKTWLAIFFMGASTALVANYLLVAFLVPSFSHKVGMEPPALINKVQAAEIYPEFVCTCCDKPLDPKAICCGIMRGMIDHIDEQVEVGLSKEDIMIDTTKKFGLKALAKESTEKEIRAILLTQAPADAPKIVIDSTSYDFGEIGQGDGVVHTLFDLKNEGQGDLVINNINTSCGCTSASIVYKGFEGPLFTMPGHGKKNPDSWQIAIAAGDTAQVKVYYDPMAHGKQKEDSLDITRTVSLFSNDPVDFEKQLRIELRRVK